jgi:hypothetical protein
MNGCCHHKKEDHAIYGENAVFVMVKILKVMQFGVNARGIKIIQRKENNVS